MLLEMESHKVEKAAEFSEEFFGFGDLSVVMMILRSKLYTNPIKIVVQEILSNARDAHREVGNENIPIKVSIPSDLNPTFEVQDFGPGITPERMSGIFLKYGASTKRDSNTQTGGFGLGAKSPFSYTDSFIIESITDGKKRIYVAYIDETSIGKMSLLSTEDTGDRNGTTIKIPVKEDDYYQFSQYLWEITQYWDVRPEGDWLGLWQECHSYDTRENFFWLETPQDRLKILIDKIPYYLTRSDLQGVDLAGKEILQVGIFSTGICFEVPCGALSVAANREKIEINSSNLAKIVAILESIKGSLADKIQKDLDSLPSYRDAVLFLAKKESLLKFLHFSEEDKTSFSWQGGKIPLSFKFAFQDFNKFSASLYVHNGEFSFDKKAKKNVSERLIGNPLSFLIVDTFSNLKKRMKHIVDQEPDKAILLLTPKFLSESDISSYSGRGIVEAKYFQDRFGPNCPKECMKRHLEGLLEDYGGAKNYVIRFASDTPYEKSIRVRQKAALEEAVVLYTQGLGVSGLKVQEMVDDPTIEVWYVGMKYGKIISREMAAHNQGGEDIDHFQPEVRRVMQQLYLPTDKIAIIGLKKVNFLKTSPEIDFFRNIGERIQGKVPFFLLQETFRSPAISPKNRYLQSREFRTLATRLHTSGGILDLTLRNLLSAYLMLRTYEDRENTPLPSFLRKYKESLALPKMLSGISSFYTFLQSYSRENYPMLAILDYSPCSDSLFAEKMILDYLNLCFANK